MENKMFEERIQNIMKYAGPAGVLITNPADLFYLTGESLEGFFLFVDSEQARVFTSVMLEEQIKQAVPFLDAAAGKDPFGTFTAFLKRRKARSLGVQYSKLKAATIERLKKNNIKPVDFGDKIVDIRQVKDAIEIENIRRSCKIAIETF